MKLKVCGQKYNVGEVAELQPDYLGFIFWEPSARSFEGDIPKLPEGIEKVGVFVDAPIDEVLEKIENYQLDGVQLHGNESPEYCEQLRHSEIVSESHPKKTLKQVQGDGLKIIKVFSIKDEFDFSILESYEEVCDYFLFDTKGKLPGGNGYTFNWKILENYPSTKPYFLSGGIGLENAEDIQSFLQTDSAKYCHAIDINSRFETEPGLKNIEKLEEFKKILHHELSR
ncbi:phosphoribosylanthranilate isomerase [Flagellimonas sp. S174]|uniref:phosphoribosylanthranilate isomerase n=1 Tax=Flagellimonas sp. S174 TaxID=3410790 RepID=UPI003BF4FF8B